MSSFLGEVDAIVWALKERLWLICESVVTVFTDLDSGQQRLNRPEIWIKETDGRVLRLLGWLLGNFAIGSQLTFAFIPGKDNMIVDQLSRWRHYKIMKNDPEDIAEFEMVNEDMKEIDNSTNEQRNDQDLRAVTLTDAMWNIGHHGHYGVKKTWLRLKQYGFQVAYDQVEERWWNCENCLTFRHRFTSDPLGHVMCKILLRLGSW